MIASAKSLERMANRKLRRRGLHPVVRGDQVFLCAPQKVQLVLGDFWSIFELDTEIRIASKTEPITSIFENRIKRFENAYDKYQKYIDHNKKEKEYNADQQAGQFEEVLRDVDKIQIQVQ